MKSPIYTAGALLLVISMLSACGGGSLNFGRVGPAATMEADPDGPDQPQVQGRNPDNFRDQTRSTIWDIFRNENTEANIQVNRYLWTASLDVLSFLPVQSVDPFSGVMVFGYGTPPGGGRAYRATVYIDDPALDARSLNVALATRSGPVAAGTARAVENAILDRARELRISDSRF